MLPLLAALTATAAANGMRCWLAPAPALELRHSRRAACAATLLGPLLTGAVAAPGEVAAFANRVEEVKGPKRPGSQPLGVGAGGPLAGCGSAPNCFSSAPGTDKDHFLPPWRFSSGGPSAAFADLEQVVRAYPPGQRNVDGGGFDVKRSDPAAGYMYVQFESLKQGYIDDVEFLVLPGTSAGSGEVQVRSASRLGYLDLGVNAKRLNKVAEDLQALPGGRWTAPKITGQTFPKYVEENR